MTFNTDAFVPLLFCHQNLRSRSSYLLSVSSDASFEPQTPGPMSVQPMASTAIKRGRHHDIEDDSNMGSEQDYEDS